MYRAIWMAGYLLLIVAPCARAVTINITEDKPNSLMVSTDESNLFKPYTAMTLPIVPPPLAPRGWIIDTTSLPSDSFTFNMIQTNGPNFYFQEPDSAFVNAVSRTSTTTLQVVSDLATPTPAPVIAFNGKPQQVGIDSDGNDVFVVFNDTLTPDPSDTPEPASLFLVGSGVLMLMAIQRARCRKGGVARMCP
jgi:hypothetical protein